VLNRCFASVSDCEKERKFPTLNFNEAGHQVPYYSPKERFLKLKVKKDP